MTDHLHRSEAFRKMVVTEVDKFMSVSEPPLSAGGFILRFVLLGICTLAMFGFFAVVASL